MFDISGFSLLTFLAVSIFSSSLVARAMDEHCLFMVDSSVLKYFRFSISLTPRDCLLQLAFIIRGYLEGHDKKWFSFLIF